MRVKNEAILSIIKGYNNLKQLKMKLLKIDSNDMLSKNDKFKNGIIKILLVCSMILIGCELYVLLKI